MNFFFLALGFSVPSSLTSSARRLVATLLEVSTGEAPAC